MVNEVMQQSPMFESLAIEFDLWRCGSEVAEGGKTVRHAD